ncbi:DUF2147 domain-containing protein [Psychrobacter sp. AOP22-C1-22]|uniref:DUF2147 domain-containing protein n=1 Tax=unclassified Psychrobacter TaxID=196806 RepID=UPI001787F96E|nr:MULTISPECIES: DUF2147 domain-containing protein [unclassified Psychrobacter]MDN5802392.1 DUF2147 domain-containing protein [Psychrobacter sp.]MBE0407793.1 DUF2147 domain-containing protein [Psychrobacter sp. FME6]MBE0444588.1 DUF2147 domain-containing protein [Psychrobacter sp. FME5]MDN5892239.1 DUF2147 domain-containing protein [Psychrobacter sp.]MDN5897615.1 DUF2147 domain-containing protein [Psychrobacter sp.]
MNRTISKALTLTAGVLLSTSVFAASLDGTQWQTIDDKTGEKKAVIQLTEKSGKVSGKIIKVLNKEKAKAVCTKCPGSLKDQPVEGLQILSGLKADGNNKWSHGKLVDPESGKTYSGKLTLSDNGQSLDLRGYVGSPVFGRSQTWQRIK